MTATTDVPRVRRPARRRGRLPVPPRVLVVSGSVGAGHDGAARELAARLRARGVVVDVEDYLAALPRLFACVLRDGYTLSVERVPLLFQWVFVMLERSVGRAVLRAFCRVAEPTVLAWTRRRAYDAVVSTYPLASQTLGALRQRGLLAAPVVTYLTDPAVHRSWVHPSVDLHLAVTAASAAQGRADYGVAVEVGGPLVPHRFASTLAAGDRAALRTALGLPADVGVALLTAGSLGLGGLDASADGVLRAGLVPLVLCGRNTSLLRRMSARPGVVALGWRDDVHLLMQAADVLVHNAGGLTFTEALVAGLPAVSYRCIPGHGLANAGVLEQAGLAPWARDEDALAAALHALVAAGRREPDRADPTGRVLDLVRATASGRQRRAAA